MDYWAMMVGLMTIACIYFGERFKAGAYLWLGMLFAIIFAERMGQTMFYMATAGLVGVLAFRAFFEREDIRDGNDREIT